MITRKLRLVLCFLSILTVIVVQTACGKSTRQTTTVTETTQTAMATSIGDTNNAVEQKTQHPVEEELDRVAEWTEPALEALVRDKIGKPTGDIMVSELDYIWGIELYGASHIFFNGNGGYDMYLSEDSSFDISDRVWSSNIDMHNYTVEKRWNLGGTYEVDEVQYERGPIKSLVDFSNFRNVKFLIAYKNSLQNISGLTRLTQLKELRLYENTISDISDLADLKQIILLDLSGNPISDVSPLASLKHLEGLYLRGTEVVDLNGLQEMDGLRILNLSSSPVRSINELKGLNKLERLYFNKTCIEDLTPLIGKNTIKSIFIGNLDIERIDLTPIRTLENLSGLNIVQDKAELQNFEVLTELKELILLDIIPNVNLSGEDISWLRRNLANGNIVQPPLPSNYIIG